MATNVRVLRISHSAVVDAWRGAERYLSDRGHEMVTLSAAVWNEGGRPVRLNASPTERVPTAATIGHHPALFCYDVRPLWRLLGEPWDVIHIHEEPFALATAQIRALRALRRNRAPYLLYSAQNLRKRYPIPFRWLERAALRGAAGLSVCNRRAGEICQDKGFPGQPRVIPLGFDSHVFKPGACRPPQPDALLVGYAGRLASHKGVAVLIEAVLADERLRLRLAGAGPEEAQLRELARPGGDRIEFLGPLDTDSLPEFYRSVDVLAVPSLSTPGWVEQFGRVVIESMACGTPVVASATGALPEVIADAGLLVSPGDPQALGSALLRLADKTLWTRLRERGLQRAARATWAEVGEDYLDLYRNMRHEASDDPRGPEVIVVAYRQPELLRRALEPLATLPVLVVDNSSMPQIADICAQLGVRYLDSGRNGGFAAGVNIGLANLLNPRSDVLLLNPDAEISSRDVDRLHRHLLAHPDLASVGPRQLDGRGAEARVAWPFPSPWGTWLEAVGLGRCRRRADYVIGSVLLLRAEALAQVGGFDERFFLYAEETDWARRASQLGWRHEVVPEATAVHIGAATSDDPAAREVHFHASQERYLRKHFGSVGWTTARLGQLLGAGVRARLLHGQSGAAAARRVQLYARGPVVAEAALAGVSP